MAPAKKIMAAVRAHPGIGIRELHRATGLAVQTVRNHVKFLSEEGRLDTARRGAKVCCVARGATLPAEKLDPHLAPMVAELARRGAMRQVEFVRLFSGVPRSTVQYRLRRMVELGLVKPHRGMVAVPLPLR
jgi:predicted transcriptional regulator